MPHFSLKMYKIQLFTAFPRPLANLGRRDEKGIEREEDRKRKWQEKWEWRGMEEEGEMRREKGGPLA